MAPEDSQVDESHTWSWDPSLYAGSARYHPVGRVPCPREIADRLQAELALDGRGRLLDVGCGPGSLTLLLAPLFGEAIGVDADPDMPGPQRIAIEAGSSNAAPTRWPRRSTRRPARHRTCSATTSRPSTPTSE